MRLNRISGGQTESVNGCERFLQTISSAQKLHAQRFKSACRAIAKKKNTAVAAVIWFLKSIYICCQSTPSTNIAMSVVDCQLPIVADVDIFLFYLSDYKHSLIVFFLVCGCGCNQSDEKVQPIKKSTIVIKLTVYKQPNCHLSDIQSMCGD